MSNSPEADRLLTSLNTKLEARLPTLATKADLALLRAELQAEIRVAAAERSIWWSELIMGVCIVAMIFLVLFALLFALQH
jgi:hypothetical protein